MYIILLKIVIVTVEWNSCGGGIELWMMQTLWYLQIGSTQGDGMHLYISLKWGLNTSETFMEESCASYSVSYSAWRSAYAVFTIYVGINDRLLWARVVSKVDVQGWLERDMALFSLCFFFLLPSSFLNTGFCYILQEGLGFIIQPRPVLYLWSFCFSFPSPGISGVHYYL